MIYLLSLLGIFKKSEHRTSTEIWEQRWRMRRGRQENKEKERKILESEREESAGCFDFILPLSAAGREMVR